MPTWGWIVVALGVVVLAALVRWWLVRWWPSRRRRAGYALALQMTGDHAPALWRKSPAALRRASETDAERLAGALLRLDGAVAACEQKKALLATDRVADLSAAERRTVRELWWGFFEPMMAIDTIKETYETWYGVDYLRHPDLHARAFALAFAALCIQARAGHALLAVVSGSTLAHTLFDETMLDFGLPEGTFTAVRTRMARTRDLSFVPLGSSWYDEWIASHLRRDAVGRKLAALVSAERARADAAMDGAPATRMFTNKLDVLKAQAFQSWFPVQKRVAEWAGHTRVVAENRRLVSNAQLDSAEARLMPGDIVIARRNWYLSNVGLPGFWPHAALYLGTPEKLRATFADDPEAAAIIERLALKHAKAWSALGTLADDGGLRTVIEAVGIGVTVTSFRHAAGADYVAALRPRLPKVVIARAIDIALGTFGRPYDFNFDFATDDALVCSELVMKAYEPHEDGPGLRVPFVTIAGRETIPPNEMIRVFDEERQRPDRQLDFVVFLDGREADEAAIEGDEETLGASWRRPKWDFAQP